ncbi:MAG: PPC domain-containing protein [Chloroflexi bacterium]|nr:PPC domain-containing protein [Chloroflexota bacterium]
MKGRKSPAGIASVLLMVLTLIGCGVPQEEFDKIKAQETALEAQQTALQKDYATLTGIRDSEVGMSDLRNAADVKFVLASAAVGLSRQADWDPSRGPGLAETATARLDDFIKDAQELTTRTHALSDQVPAEARSVYEKSARLYEANIKEAQYLKELVQGISLQHATESAISDAYFTCVAVTDALKSGWISKLDAAVAHYQAGIAVLNEAEKNAPELSSKFGVAVAELERLIKQVSALKKDPVPPPDPGADDDHGQTATTATPAELPCSIVGTIGYVGDLDYFSFQAQAGTTYVVQVAGGTQGEFVASLSNSQGQQLAYPYSYGQLGITYTATTSAALYVAVQNNRSGTGSYMLSISVPTDDHGNSTSRATAAQVPSSTAGSIDYGGDLDYFSFQAQADTTYVIGLAGGTQGEFVASLSNSQGQQLTYPYSYGQLGITYTATTSAALYVAVQNNRSGTGSYTLSISVPTDDHGNSTSKATAAKVSSSTDGAIEYVGDLDYFSFQAKAGTTYLIKLSLGTLSNSTLILYNASDQQLAGGQAYQGQKALITHTAATSEALYVVVDNRQGGTTGSYTLSLSEAEPDDHGNAISTATAVQAPSSTAGSIDYAGDLDYFSFQAKAGTTYLIELSPGTLSYSVFYLYSASGQQLANGQAYQGQKASITYTAPTSGALYVVVDNRQGGTAGSYTLSLSVPKDDHGNSISTATVVQAPSSTAGSIDYAGDPDYFSFQAKAGTAYVIATSPGTLGAAYLALYNASGQQLTSWQSSITYTAKGSEAVYVVVQGSGSTGSYTLGIFVFVPAS